MFAPLLLRPSIAFAVVGLLVAVLLAMRSVAYPLAFAALPTVIDAIVGHNPLPKGGVTLIFAVWVTGAIALALIRERHSSSARIWISAPVILSFLLLGLMLLRLGVSADQAYGSTKVQLYVADNIVFLLGAVFVGSRREDLRLFLVISLMIAVIAALLMVGNLVSGSAVARVGGRFSLSAVEYPIYLGRLAANGILIAIYVIVATVSHRSRVAALVTVPLLIAALLAAGSRGPVVALVVALITFAALASTHRRARRRLLLVAGVLMATAAVVPIVVPGSVVSRALSALVGGAAGLSSNGRFTLWAHAYEMFEAHPFLGAGTGSFAAFNELNYPHNILLEIAAELGLVGLIVIIGIVGALVFTSLRAWYHSSSVKRVELALIVALLVNAIGNALVSGAIQDNMEVWLWGGLGVGVSAAMSRSSIGPGSVVRLRQRAPGRALQGA